MAAAVPASTAARSTNRSRPALSAAATLSAGAAAETLAPPAATSPGPAAACVPSGALRTDRPG
eukprot:2136645-Alexandrium_andersonii.AAC.1